MTHVTVVMIHMTGITLHDSTNEMKNESFKIILQLYLSHLLLWQPLVWYFIYHISEHFKSVIKNLTKWRGDLKATRRLSGV